MSDSTDVTDYSTATVTGRGVGSAARGRGSPPAGIFALNRGVRTVRSEDGSTVGSVLTQSPGDDIGRTQFYGAHYQTTGGLGLGGGLGVGFGMWKFPLKYQLAVRQKKTALQVPLTVKAGSDAPAWATGFTANSGTTLQFQTLPSGGVISTGGPATDAQGNVQSFKITFGTNLPNGKTKVTLVDAKGKSASIVTTIGGTPLDALKGLFGGGLLSGG